MTLCSNYQHTNEKVVPPHIFARFGSRVFIWVRGLGAPCKLFGCIFGSLFSHVKVPSSTPSFNPTLEPIATSHGDPIIWTFDNECYDLNIDGLYVATKHPKYNHVVKIAVPILLFLNGSAKVFECNFYVCKI